MSMLGAALPPHSGLMVMTITDRVVRVVDYDTTDGYSPTYLNVENRPLVSDSTEGAFINASRR